MGGIRGLALHALFPLSALQPHLASVSWHTADPAPAWMADKDHQPPSDRPIPQPAIGTPRLSGAYKHVHAHSHMTEASVGITNLLANLH